MIYVVDRFVEGHLHVLANVNTIRILNIIFPTHFKKIILENSHNQFVQQYFSDEDRMNLNFEPYKNPVFENDSKITRIFRVINRLIQDISFFVKLFKLVSIQPQSFIFITHIYPLSLVFIKLLKKIYPKITVIITIHGEVEYLFYGKSKYERIIGKLYGFTFSLKAKNIYYLFLTKISREILTKSKRLKDKELLTIILPTLSSYKSKKSEAGLRRMPIRIGHIGSAGKRKNTQYLYSIAEDFKNVVLAEKVIFSVIGPIEDNIAPYLNSYVANFVNDIPNVHLDRGIFNSEIENIDYSIFFYGEHDFVLRSSAAFFDAIYFEKPMIVLKNDFFVDVFAEAGNMGYLCDDLEDMKNVIEKIINNEYSVQQDYQKHLLNISKYKLTLELEIIAKDLSMELESCGFSFT